MCFKLFELLVNIIYYIYYNFILSHLAIHICPKAYKVGDLDHTAIFLERNTTENGCKNVLVSVLYFIQMDATTSSRQPPKSSPAN